MAWSADNIVMAYSFDEQDLRRRLSGISIRSQAIFAASCATRLSPKYKEYIHRIHPHHDEADPILKALSYLWASLIAGRNGPGNLDEIIGNCEKHQPDEDEACDLGYSYASDAAAAIYYALCVCKSESIQNAIWCARRIYEALDHYVINTLNIVPSTLDGEREVLKHPLVQRELSRQYRDTQQLASAPGDHEIDANQYYSRASSESNDVLPQPA